MCNQACFDRTDGVLPEDGDGIGREPPPHEPIGSRLGAQCEHPPTVRGSILSEPHYDSVNEQGVVPAVIPEVLVGRNLIAR